MNLPDLLAGASIKADIGFGVGDLHDIFAEALREERDAARKAERDWLYIDRLTANGVTDASGDLTIAPIWSAPQGYRVNIHRLVIDYAGSSASAPFTTSIDVRMYYGASTLALGDLFGIGAALPIVFEWSNERVAPVIRSMEAIAIVIKSGPATKQVNAMCQVSVTKETTI